MFYTGMTMQRVRVMVTAISDIPVSWTGMVWTTQLSLQLNATFLLDKYIKNRNFNSI